MQKRKEKKNEKKKVKDNLWHFNRLALSLNRTKQYMLAFIFARRRRSPLNTVVQQSKLPFSLHSTSVPLALF